MTTDQGAIYVTDNAAYTWTAAVQETVDATLNRTVSSGITGASYYEGSFSNVARWGAGLVVCGQLDMLDLWLVICSNEGVYIGAGLQMAWHGMACAGSASAAHHLQDRQQRSSLSHAPLQQQPCSPHIPLTPSHPTHPLTIPHHPHHPRRSKDGDYVAVSSRGNFYMTWQPGQTYWFPHNRPVARRLQNMGWTPNKQLWASTRGGDVLLSEDTEKFSTAKLNSRGFGVLDVG